MLNMYAAFLLKHLYVSLKSLPEAKNPHHGGRVRQGGEKYTAVPSFDHGGRVFRDWIATAQGHRRQPPSGKHFAVIAPCPSVCQRIGRVVTKPDRLLLAVQRPVLQPSPFLAGG